MSLASRKALSRNATISGLSEDVSPTLGPIRTSAVRIPMSIGIRPPATSPQPEGIHAEHE